MKDSLRNIKEDKCYSCRKKFTKLKSTRCDGDAKICENKKCSMFIKFKNIKQTWKKDE